MEENTEITKRKGGAPKGHVRYGGRAKGTPNKVSIGVRELLAKFMDEKFEQVIEAWDGLEPDEKVKTYISMIPYVMPKLNSVTVQEQNGDDLIKKILEGKK